MKAAKSVGGGIISVPCGYGKTVIGLYVTTLVLKHFLKHYLKLELNIH